jgi:hypothetical protein
LAAKIRKNTQTAKFIWNLSVTTAKFIWNLAVLIVEPLFGFTANTRFSYKLFLFKLRLAKKQKNLQSGVYKMLGKLAGEGQNGGSFQKTLPCWNYFNELEVFT